MCELTQEFDDILDQEDEIELWQSGYDHEEGDDDDNYIGNIR